MASASNWSFTGRLRHLAMTYSGQSGQSKRDYWNMNVNSIARTRSYHMVALGFVAVGLRPNFAVASVLPTPDGTATQEQFEKTISKYPYQAPTETVEKIKGGLKQVLRCMNKKQMRSLLGEPDFGYEHYGPKGLNAKWIGTGWTYYLTKRADSSNTNDTVVQVFFDRTERASWIVPTHIESARELGGPGGKCT
jgi:hypothetical protein